MINLKQNAKKFQLALLFAAIVFTIILLTMFLMFTGIFILQKFGIHTVDEASRIPLFLFAAVSLCVGTIFALLASKYPLKSIRIVGQAADEIAGGTYKVRISLKGPDEFTQLSSSFNHMAEELNSVEMLRTDFVNNFSHEFKTPIVSIRGFAKMLKREDLTDDERDEYLNIIIEESERLTKLASNVLSLTKLEQQSVLTDTGSCNITEQIRLVIAMMYSKWSQKDMTFDFDCGERYVNGNEELLKQVWINMLDNAVKFSPNHSTVRISITQRIHSTTVSIGNDGSPIDEDISAHIFDKFYQGDTSHTEKGNGLGLAIVKRIVELHHGNIRLADGDGKGTVFEITFPKKQI